MTGRLTPRSRISTSPTSASPTGSPSSSGNGRAPSASSSTAARTPAGVWWYEPRRRELLVVERPGRQRHLAPRRAAAVQHHLAARARQRRGGAPGLGPPDGLDDRVGAASTGQRAAQRGDPPLVARSLVGRLRPEPQGPLAALGVGVGEVHPAPAPGEGAREELPLHPAAEDEHRVPGPGPAAAGGVERAGQRLGHRAERRRQPGRERERVARDDRGRHAQELGERPGQVDDRVAEVLAPLAAGGAAPARRRVRHHDRVAGARPCHAVADRGHRAGRLVAERRRQGAERGVRAGPHHLRVGGAGEGGVDPHDHLARARLRVGHLLEAEVPGAVQDERAHPADATAPRPPGAARAAR